MFKFLPNTWPPNSEAQCCGLSLNFFLNSKWVFLRPWIYGLKPLGSVWGPLQATACRFEAQGLSLHFHSYESTSCRCCQLERSWYPKSPCQHFSVAILNFSSSAPDGAHHWWGCMAGLHGVKADVSCYSPAKCTPHPSWADLFVTMSRPQVTVRQHIRTQRQTLTGPGQTWTFPKQFPFSTNTLGYQGQSPRLWELFCLSLNMQTGKDRGLELSSMCPVSLCWPFRRLQQEEKRGATCSIRRLAMQSEIAQFLSYYLGDCSVFIG